MRITPDTKLGDLLRERPELLEFLASYRPEFKKLRNPVLRNTVARFATLEAVAEMGGVPVEKLIGDIRAFLEGKGVEASESHEEPEDRSAAIKEILKKLHEGVPVEELKEEFKARLGDLDPVELARAEQRLVLEEGISPTEIQRLCDLHVAVFQDALEQAELPGGGPHPLKELLDENREILPKAQELAEALRRPRWQKDLVERLEELWRLVNEHYLRKENLLFPFLEKRGITVPPQVMWGVHDEIRQGLQELITAAREGYEPVLARRGPEVMRQIVDMVFKEESILVPLALHSLTVEDWQEMAKARDEGGWKAYREGGSELLRLKVGFLTPEQVDLIFRHLPVDITFVDEEDTVRFYSGTPERIFPRTPSVIGRRVQNCHPPKSVHIVQRILDEFKAGRRDVAEFWINYKGRLVHIRYFAVRDEEGRYRGTLEVTQDVTDIKALEGEKRLLDWS